MRMERMRMRRRGGGSSLCSSDDVRQRPQVAGNDASEDKGKGEGSEAEAEAGGQRRGQEMAFGAPSPTAAETGGREDRLCSVRSLPPGTGTGTGTCSGSGSGTRFLSGTGSSNYQHHQHHQQQQQGGEPARRPPLPDGGSRPHDPHGPVVQRAAKQDRCRSPECLYVLRRRPRHATAARGGRGGDELRSLVV